MIRTMLFGGDDASPLTDGARALLRVFSGLALAFAHGLGKLPVSPGFVERTAELGFPLPGLFAWSAALAEFAGGLLLALGLLTRPASFFIVVTMCVAAFIRHAEDPFVTKEKALLFGVVALMYLIAGAGRYSVDAMIRRKKPTYYSDAEV